MNCLNSTSNLRLMSSEVCVEMGFAFCLPRDPQPRAWRFEEVQNGVDVKKWTWCGIKWR